MCVNMFVCDHASPAKGDGLQWCARVCVCVCQSLARYKDNGTVEGFSWQTDRNTDGK